MTTKALKCVHCSEIFGQWMLSHMHLELHRLEAKGVVKEANPVIKSKRCLVGAINFIGEGC